MKSIWSFALLLITLPVFAASPLRVATGGPTGNYFTMGNDIMSYCSSALPDGKTMEIINTDGSITNLMGMTSKKFSAGWVQEDVLHYFSKQQPNKVNTNRLKVLVGGHQEDIHVLIPTGWEPKGQKTSWRQKLSNMLNDKPPAGVSLDSLKGQTVASWGGSLISAKALSMFTGLGMQTTEIKNGDTPNSPILLVGGQPYGPVESYLAKGYQLLPVNADSVTSKAGFYVKSTLNYEVGGKIMSVPSFGVRALFVGKSFRNEARNATMVSLTKCISDSLIDLADDPDTNPNWASVVELEEEGQTNWSYFKLQ